MKKLACIALAAAFLVVSTPAEEVQAQVAFGPQAVLWDFDDFGIGARVDWNMGEAFDIDEGFFENLTGSFNANYVFDDFNDATTLIFNINAHVPFDIDAGVTPFAGTGINHYRISVDGPFSFSGSGLNLLGGIMFGLGDIPAFTELQYSTTGAGFISLSFGVLFGG